MRSTIASHNESLFDLFDLLYAYRIRMLKMVNVIINRHSFNTKIKLILLKHRYHVFTTHFNSIKISNCLKETGICVVKKKSKHNLYLKMMISTKKIKKKMVATWRTFRTTNKKKYKQFRETIYRRTISKIASTTRRKGKNS